MSKLKMQDAGFTIGVNFCITKRDKKTGRVLQQEKSHNRCLMNQLTGIAKFLNGEFNNTADTFNRDYFNWIPRYLGIGTNVSAGESSVGTTVKMTDTRLLNEILPESGRMKLPETNKIITRAGQAYIQIVIEAYLPNELFNNMDLREAGLFSKEKGNNCLFRIIFPEVHKEENSVVMISWTITIISIDSQGDPTVVVDKTDLELAFQTAMTKLAAIYPNTTDLAKALYDSTDANSAILVYGDRAATQETVNKCVEKLNKLSNELTGEENINDVEF